MTSGVGQEVRPRVQHEHLGDLAGDEAGHGHDHQGLGGGQQRGEDVDDEPHVLQGTYRVTHLDGYRHNLPLT